MLQTPNDLIIIAQSVLQKALVKFCSSLHFAQHKIRVPSKTNSEKSKVEAVLEELNTEVQRVSIFNTCFRLYKLHLQHSIFLTTPHNKLRKQAALHSDNVQAILNLNSKLNKISINKQHRQ